MTNTFEKMKNEAQPSKQDEPIKQKNEIDPNMFSDRPVGEQISYTRPDLDGKEDVISSFVVSPGDPTEAFPEGKIHRKVDCKLTYESANEDGIQNHEYISGVLEFKQRDGTISTPKFWYSGGQNQACKLWESVAEHKGIEPEEMSPRDFYVFLNSKPKIVIKKIEVENWNPEKQRKDGVVYKNMPGKFM